MNTASPNSAIVEDIVKVAWPFKETTYLIMEHWMFYYLTISLFLSLHNYFNLSSRVFESAEFLQKIISDNISLSWLLCYLIVSC